MGINPEVRDGCGVEVMAAAHRRTKVAVWLWVGTLRCFEHGMPVRRLACARGIVSHVQLEPPPVRKNTIATSSCPLPQDDGFGLQRIVDAVASHLVEITRHAVATVGVISISAAPTLERVPASFPQRRASKSTTGQQRIPSSAVAQLRASGIHIYCANHGNRPCAVQGLIFAGLSRVPCVLGFIGFLPPVAALTAIPACKS